MYHLFGGAVLGWALGANDAANVFGTGVASHMVRYRTAAILTGIFVIIGAAVGGAGGIRTLSGLTTQTARSAMIVTSVAGFAVISMTVLKLPVSSSQATVGAIIGMGLATAPANVSWSVLEKIVICWVGTPIGAALIAAVLYPSLGWVMDRLPINLITRSILLKVGILISGAYGAFALGANNVANVTGVFYHTSVTAGMSRPELTLSLIGGGAIALGAATFSRNVMFTVGSKLVQLGAFSAFVAVLSQALTIHIYAQIGVPVSTSQAIVGAVLGIGLTKSVRTIHARTLVNIVIGWVMTPAAAGLLCYLVAMLAA